MGAAFYKQPLFFLSAFFYKQGVESIDMKKENTCDKVRLDKWLWAARFFKTRSMATEAINGGHVQVNGDRSKPSRLVNVGDEIRIRKETVEFTVIVDDLAEKRGSATIAQTLYSETEASLAARAEQAEARKLRAASGMTAPARKPSKRDRRHIIRFVRKGDE